MFSAPTRNSYAISRKKPLALQFTRHIIDFLSWHNNLKSFISALTQDSGFN